MRRYGRKPVLINQRLVWEFQAVLRGEIRLLLPGSEQPLRHRRLWIFPPCHPHGWGGRNDATAEIAVFHYPHVPEPLRLQFRERAFLEISLEADQCARLRKLARQARGYWENPTSGMLLCHEQILLELSLIALESGRPMGKSSHSLSSEPIEKALHWFSRNIESDCNLDEAARTAGVSVAHLRRMFHSTFETSPKHIFDQLRFQRAKQLIADTSTKLESVSQQCGFGSASAFSRAFRNKFGITPDAWRNGV